MEMVRDGMGCGGVWMGVEGLLVYFGLMDGLVG